jgi:hypothetical protein
MPPRPTPTQTRPQPAAVGSAVWWRFEETSGTTAQDVLGVRPGTLQGGVTRTANGRFGRGLTFDGSSGFVRESAVQRGPASPSPSPPGSATPARSRTSSSTASPASPPTAPASQPARRPRLPVAWSGRRHPRQPVDHVAYTWDGTNSRLYVNGTQTAISSTPPRSRHRLQRRYRQRRDCLAGRHRRARPLVPRPQRRRSCRSTPSPSQSAMPRARLRRLAPPTPTPPAAPPPAPSPTATATVRRERPTAAPASREVRLQ